MLARETKAGASASERVQDFVDSELPQSNNSPHFLGDLTRRDQGSKRSRVNTEYNTDSHDSNEIDHFYRK